VLGRGEAQGQAIDFAGIPPVQLINVGNTAFDKPGLDPEWHQPARRLAGRQTLDRRFVQMVVVVVRNQHEINARQVFNSQGRRHDTARRQPRDGAGVVAQVRVEQNVLAADLQEHAGMSEPGDDRAFMRLGDAGTVHWLRPLFDEGRVTPGRRCGRAKVTPRATPDNFVPRHPAEFQSRVAIDETLRPVMCLVGLVVGIRAATGGEQNDEEECEGSHDQPLTRLLRKVLA